MDGARARAGGVEGAAGSSGEVGPRRAIEGPRARLDRLGVAALTDPELLAVLLGQSRSRGSVVEFADRLIEAGGGLRALFLLDPHELCAVPGLGRSRAAQLMAALELCRRLQRCVEARPKLCSPSEVFEHLRPSLSLLRREVFQVLCFNSRNVLLREVRVAEGSQDSCPVDPREVFAAALGAKATAIVVAHNHPSGDPEPSLQDLALTRQLMAGARLLGIKLLDHLVLGDGAFTSLRMRGQLPDETQERGREWNSR